RMAANDLHRVANARKAFGGQYQGLLDPAVLARKRQEEEALAPLFVKGDGGAAGRGEDPWAKIRAAQEKLRGFERDYLLLERGDAFFTELFTIARHLVRMAAELPKPSTERLREYRDSNLESLKFQLFSPAPIHAELERAKLAGSLTFLAEHLGG